MNDPKTQWIEELVGRQRLLNKYLDRLGADSKDPRAEEIRFELLGIELELEQLQGRGES